MAIRHLTTEGMDVKELAVFTSMFALLRRSLSADWRVNQAPGEPDAVLTDVDTVAGRFACGGDRHPSAARILATSATGTTAEWLVLKPWHRGGEHSLVDVLNRLDASLREAGGPGSPVESFREHATRAIQRAIEEAEWPLPLPVAVESVVPDGDAPSLRTPRPMVTERADAAMSVRAALAEIRTQGLTVQLTISDLPPIFVDGRRSRFSTSLRSAVLLRELSKLAEPHCDLRQVSHERIDVDGWKELNQLEWLARLTSADAPVSGDEAFLLKRWPDFKRYAADLVHLRMGPILLREPTTIPALAQAVSSSPAAAAAFVHACDLLGLIKRETPRTRPSSQEQSSASRPANQDASKRAGFLRSVISTILRRS